MKLSRFYNHISSYQFFQVFRFGAMFLIGILFTKSHLTISEIGNYETLMFISGAVSFFWVSGLMNSMLALSKKEKDNPSFYFNAFLLMALFSVIIVLAMIGLRNQISAWLVQGRDIQYYNLLLIFILLNTPTFLIEHLLLLKKQSRKIITYAIFIFSMQIIAVSAPIFLGYSIESSIMALIFIAIIKLFYLAYLIHRNSTIKIDIEQLKEHLILAAPLMITALFSGSADYIDGIIVSKNFSPATFAIFRYGARELPFTLLMANAMSVAMIPIIASTNLKESLTQIKEKSTRLMHLLFPITIVLLMSSKWLYPVVFNAQFIDSATIFNVFLMLIISRLVFPQTILIGLRKTRIIMIAAFIEIVINVVSSLILLRYFGIIGVAMGTIVAYFSEKLILILYNYFFLKIKPADYFSIPILAIYSILLISCYFLVQYYL